MAWNNTLNPLTAKQGTCDLQSTSFINAHVNESTHSKNTSWKTYIGTLVLLILGLISFIAVGISSNFNFSEGYGKIWEHIIDVNNLKIYAIIAGSIIGGIVGAVIGTYIGNWWVDKRPRPSLAST